MGRHLPNTLGPFKGNCCIRFLFRYFDMIYGVEYFLHLKWGLIEKMKILK